MKFINEDLGNRLWGMSLVLWLITSVDYNAVYYNHVIRITAAVVMMYFITFGTSRFTPEYRKML